MIQSPGIELVKFEFSCFYYAFAFTVQTGVLGMYIVAVAYSPGVVYS